MILILLAYLGGALTIVSPCILPVLPFVFARADRPFLTNGLPMLVGMAVMFALVATLAAVGGGWAVEANRYGRGAALALLALFGLSLLLPALGDRAMQPLVRLGGRLSQHADNQGSGIGASLLLGVATGLLWAPCAGPILGLVLTGAALEGAKASTTLLLLAYAAGAATSLALALVVGGGLFRAMKRSLGAGAWARRVIGAAVLVGVAAIALGLDTGLLARLSIGGTTSLEQGLLDRFGQEKPAKPMKGIADRGPMPSLGGATLWLNSPPLTPESLKGKVVLVDFWTYSCINCIRTIPYVRAWAEKYRNQGLVVIGVHSPEFAFEKDEANVRKALGDFGITYPVALDNDFAIWRAFRNRYWPAHFLIDAKGRIRRIHNGEGGAGETERYLQKLLAEAHPGIAAGGKLVTLASAGAQAGASNGTRSPETYVGSARVARFAAAGGMRAGQLFDYPNVDLKLDQWTLTGNWRAQPQYSELVRAGGRIRYHFQARDVHLVLGAPGRPVRFRVTIDGKAPGADHGADVDAAGRGIVTGQRLYQLVRLAGGGAQRDFAIEFLDPGVQAYAFTFG